MRLSKRRQDAPSGVVPFPGTDSLSFDRALGAFLQSQDASNHSKMTKYSYKTVLTLFWRYMVEEHGYSAVEQVMEENIVGWLAHLRNSLNAYGRPYSSRTIATYNRDVLTFFHWLVDRRYLTADPTVHLREIKVDKTLIRVFTTEELERLDAACSRPLVGRSITADERKMLAARDRAILWLLLSTGIRLSELCGLRFCDIDWDQGAICVRGKGSKERVVPMGAVARQHLNTYIVYWRGAPADSDESFFLRYSVNRLSSHL
jgi:site-specific recombinase XerD